MTSLAFGIALFVGLLGAILGLIRDTQLKRTRRELNFVKDAKRALQTTLLNLDAVALTDPPCWHELKTWPEYFIHVHLGTKTVEVRLNDRDFKKGDGLLLREYNPMSCKYTGLTAKRVITHVGIGMTGVQPDYAVLSIRPVFDGEE